MLQGELTCDSLSLAQTLLVWHLWMVHIASSLDDRSQWPATLTPSLMLLLHGTRMASSFLQEQAFPPLLMWARSSPLARRHQLTVGCTSVLCPMCMAMTSGPSAFKFEITVRVHWTVFMYWIYVRTYVDVTEYFSQSMDTVKVIISHSEWFCTCIYAPLSMCL